MKENITYIIFSWCANEIAYMKYLDCIQGIIDYCYSSLALLLVLLPLILFVS